MSTPSATAYSTVARPTTTARSALQLLEINVISAQDLALISRNMRTYAIAWVHPKRKLSTRVDSKNSNNPSWNDKFVFRVDESFLRSDTAAVMIEIYAVKWFRDVRVGSVNVLVGNLLPPNQAQPHNPGMRFVALQVRRPSGRPQGILNIGVALLDGHMRSMPLYTQLSASAVGYRDLMGEEHHSPNHHPHFPHNKSGFMRKTRSERQSNVTDIDYPRKSVNTFLSTEYGDPPLVTITTGSTWSESDVGPPASTFGAGATADDLFTLPETGGDVIDEWDPEKIGTIEDLKTKLERWKTELPAQPIVPVRPPSTNYGSFNKSKSHKVGHRRRHTDGGSLFSCFGDSYGFECSVSCGVKPRKGRRKDGLLLSDSDDTMPFPKYPK
ncbi:Calcium-dependent lipid-binding (CaLB domain) family protein [Thalictrum thalictroides]|uniref:Calcium-dependent lipid-binding (CaLB domain) family protein n=1 Tax=Thalictrum thalictroides TaxID=46969 RepID=A0A7J6VPT3_THATH|nr:Calcium-dependent lipid-binding (CaLB domain) family protein [Thalictrum thalictroides]